MKRRVKTIQDIPILLESIIKKPITISQNASILEARDIINRYRIGRLVVSANSKAVGIITEKDIVKNISVFSKRSLTKTKVSDIMSKNLVTATLQDTLKTCAKMMLDNGISSIIIKDKNGILEGVITKTDLVSSFLVQSTASLNTAKAMTKKVITASPEDSIYEVESMLFNNKVSRIIVEKKGSVIGIITYRDFIPAKSFDLYTSFAEHSDIMSDSILNEFNVNRVQHLLTFKAKDIMTRNPISISADEPLYTSAILMIRNGISGLPVLRKMKLAGIITKTDIVKVIASESKDS